ncbi:hypothetical protein LTR62_002717 [Meristemomyces frigidus]|uniref:Uncharacterized protein n=1 Tax=Meristemomyces frigidus TaxID=1508187 RepID=A0AAN7YS22_9PEZI|nr:hypothetical protein LTR62_002717 [Meristemomyces frigidus]
MAPNTSFSAKNTKPVTHKAPAANIGGFIGGPPRRKVSRIKWTLENDNRLLGYGLCREVGKDTKVGRAEFQLIADSFPERPTTKAIEERYTKLRKAQLELLKELGLFDIDAVRERQEGDEEVGIGENPESQARGNKAAVTSGKDALDSKAQGDDGVESAAP